MQSNLIKNASFSRFQYRRIGLPALVLGFCAFACLTQQAALGQAQLGAAETCFDEGPDRLPANPATPVPAPPRALPISAAWFAIPARSQPVKLLTRVSMDAPVRLQRQAVLYRSHWTPPARKPEGILTAAR